MKKHKFVVGDRVIHRFMNEDRVATVTERLGANGIKGFICIKYDKPIIFNDSQGHHKITSARLFPHNLKLIL